MKRFFSFLLVLGFLTICYFPSASAEEEFTIDAEYNKVWTAAVLLCREQNFRIKSMNKEAGYLTTLPGAVGNKDMYQLFTDSKASVGGAVSMRIDFYRVSENKTKIRIMPEFKHAERIEGDPPKHKEVIDNSTGLAEVDFFYKLREKILYPLGATENYRLGLSAQFDPKSNRFVVTNLERGFPAEKDLQTGDILESIDGKDIKSWSDYYDCMFAGMHSPDKRKITVSRDGKKMSVKITPNKV